MRGRSLAPGRVLPAKSVSLRNALRNSSPFYFSAFTRSHRFQLPTLHSPLSAFRFPLSIFALHRIHEGALDVVEKNNANKQNRKSESGAVAEIDPVERPAAEKGVAEGLDDRRHWVCQDEPAETAAANH